MLKRRGRPSAAPCPGLRVKVGLLNLAQGTAEVPEIARTQCLDSGTVCSIERGHRVWASRRSGGLGRAKPQADVKGVNRPGRWVRVRVRNGVGVHNRGWTAPRGDDKGLNA